MNKRGLAGVFRLLAAILAVSSLLWCHSAQIIVSAATLEDVFDEHYYADSYKDLKEVYGYDREVLWDHYLQQGMAEGRDMSALINVVKYRRQYADLDAIFGDDWNAYINHYLAAGAKEGRDSGMGNEFDAFDYAARYADLQATYGDDVLALWKHYQTTGIQEGREARSKKEIEAQGVLASGTCGNLVHWAFKDGVLTISGTGAMNDYEPKKVPWINQLDSITSVDILDGVTRIGARAFEACGSLTSVTIPDSVTRIGAYAFMYCSSLSAVTIPESVVDIESWAFFGTGLKSAAIPRSVTKIGNGAFSTDIYVADGNPAYRSLDGVLFSADQTLLHTYPAGKSGPYSIPASVTSIGDSAFHMAGGLTSVTIPDGVTSIGRGAFAYCGSLADIAIPDSVVGIGSNAFLGTGLKNVSYAGTKAQWEAIPIAVDNEPLFSAEIIYVPDDHDSPKPEKKNETLPDWYFLIAIFKNVDADCYDGDGVMTHTTHSMTREEMNFIIKQAKTFEKNMNEIGVMRAHVDFVEIDEPVTELAETEGGSWLAAEQAAPLLKDKVDLDQYDHVFCVVNMNVRMAYRGLAGSAFENGTGHSCVNYMNEEYTLSDFNPALPGAVYFHEYLHFMEFMSKKWGAGFDLHGIGNSYKPVVDEWKACYTDIILNQVKGDPTLGTGVSPAAWQYPPHIIRTMRELTIPDGVTSIGERAFANCGSLVSVTIPASVTSIGNGAFQGASDLTSITIPDGVTSIGEWAFADCGSLASVTIPASVTSIGDSAFRGASGLASVTIPVSVTSIEYAAFWDVGVEDVYYGGSEKQWNEIAIGEYNDALTNATIHYAAPTIY